jgi:hypothetical protein
LDRPKFSIQAIDLGIRNWHWHTPAGGWNQNPGVVGNRARRECKRINKGLKAQQEIRYGSGR